MTESGESAKQGTVLGGECFKTAVALAEGRAYEMRSSLAMTALRAIHCAHVHVCVCTCMRVFPGQGKTEPFLPVSIHGYTIRAEVWGALP